MTLTKKIAHISLFLVCTIIYSLGLVSCNEDQFSSNPKYRLEFSTDTLTFDTVFTNLGSATSKILVYNHNNVALKISQINLENNVDGAFHINVDGAQNASNKFEDIEIRAHDSLYVFVAVNVGGNNANAPIIAENAIIFNVNGVNQNIRLQAFGKNVVILKGKRYNLTTILNAQKPYLIYDSLVVAPGKTLILNPGCKLYFHNNASLIVYGNLEAKGTALAPITMRGDRLDKIKFETPFPYNNVAGQWGGVFLLWSGGNHVLQHVNMNSGYVGIYFSNSDRNTLPKLDISNCKIHNFLLYGLVVQNGNVTVTNTEISNTSSYSVYLNGGKHTFIQSTIANYFNNSSVQSVSRDKKPAVMIMNLNRVAPMETVFKNCIITGSSENEFSLASRFVDLYKGTFDHCYIRTAKALTSPQFLNSDIRWYEKNDTIFKSITYNVEKETYFNFMPDSVSPARGLADPAVAAQYPLDLNGNNRLEDGKPDAGAYEWVSTKK